MSLVRLKKKSIKGKRNIGKGGILSLPSYIPAQKYPGWFRDVPILKEVVATLLKP
jgi:hypothetical protein